jgi:hypothetical protein
MSDTPADKLWSLRTLKAALLRKQIQWVAFNGPLTLQVL